jgi:hypothetical protein
VAVGEIGEEPVVVSGGEDGTVRLWDVRVEGPITTITLGSMVGHLVLYRPSGLAVNLAGGLLVIDFPPSSSGRSSDRFHKGDRRLTGF